MTNAVINRSDLISWNAKIETAFAGLPDIDAVTLAQPVSGARNDDEEPARRTLDEALKGAPIGTAERLESEYFGLGPVAPLLASPTVTEIMINAFNSIWFEIEGRVQVLNDSFVSEFTYRCFFERVCREAKINTSLDLPFGDGEWRGCRIHAITPPASGQTNVMTIRRHPLNPWTLTRLQDLQWASEAAFLELQRLIDEKRNFLVIGGTGSGKTSVLNACLNSMPQTDRVVMIEDTSELHSPNSASVKLLTRRDPHGHLRDIHQSDLLKQALRMRPDRIVMGEIRGEEAKDLLMAFATGHTGCMGTLHAETARQALIRLEMLIQLGAPQWGLHAVRTLIWLSLQNIVVVKKDKAGRRVLDGIYRVTALEEFGFLLERTV